LGTFGQNLVYTTLCDDLFRHWSNIKVFASILEAAVLVLVMGGIYGVCRWDGLR
jgi:hypothetical protein